MTPLTKAQIEAMLAAEHIGGPLHEALRHASPDLARTAIALHDRVAELEGALRDIQARAGSTRGEQAYRELPSFVIKATAKALRGKAT